jgi:hypothetical protein
MAETRRMRSAVHSDLSSGSFPSKNEARHDMSLGLKFVSNWITSFGTSFDGCRAHEKYSKGRNCAFVLSQEPSRRIMERVEGIKVGARQTVARQGVGN